MSESELFIGSSTGRIIKSFAFDSSKHWIDADFKEELSILLRNLPAPVTTKLVECAQRNGYDSSLVDLCEIYLQRGRKPEAIFADSEGKTKRYFIVDHIIVQSDIQLFAQLFQQSEAGNSAEGGILTHNRKGLPHTLHRLSIITHPGKVNSPVLGVTARIGRVVKGIIAKMAPQLIDRSDESGKGPLLLIGKPGVGKTTVLRELARLLSDDMSLNVVVVDKTCEIAGDGLIPHKAIGSARWMPVDRVQYQHKVMVEAVENQSPDVMIVDEISTVQEVNAARTIAQRGVRLIATVHGRTLFELINCRERGTLCGGQHTVTLSDAAANKRADRRKSVQKRMREPVFRSAVELHTREHWVLHPDIKLAVDGYFDGELIDAVELLPGKSVAICAIPQGDGSVTYCNLVGSALIVEKGAIIVETAQTKLVPLRPRQREGDIDDN
eukprot:g6165.t1